MLLILLPGLLGFGLGVTSPSAQPVDWALIVLLFLVLAALAFLVLQIWTRRATARTRRLDGGAPNLPLLPRHNSLVTAINLAYGHPESPEPGRFLSPMLSMRIAQQAVELWGGPVRAPVLQLAIPRSSIGSVVSGVMTEGVSSYRCLWLRLEDRAESWIPLPLVRQHPIVGHVPLSAERLEEYRSALVGATVTPTPA